MVYPILAYEETDKIGLFGFESERNFKHTSRELLKKGIFNNVLIIDATGCKYKLENVREAGWANSFWGFSIFRKGRQILIDFDLKLIGRESIEEIKNFSLKRLQSSKDNILKRELVSEIKHAESIPQVIGFFI